MMLQSVYMTILLILTCYGCVRSLKYPIIESCFCSVLLFVSILVERNYSSTRMENWIPIFFFSFYGIYNEAREGRNQWSKKACTLCAGIFIGLGAISYYPQSPFFLLACLVLLIYVKAKATDYVFLTIGALIVLLGRLRWMNFDLTFLITELKAYNSSNKPLLHWPTLDRIHLLAEILLLDFSILLIWLSKKYLNVFSLISLVSSLSIFVAHPATAVLPAVTGVLAVALFLISLKRESIFNVTILLGSIVVIIKFAGISAMVFYQKEARNYNNALPTFKEVFQQTSVVGFSQYAWLGLRMTMQKGEIHFMPLSDSPQVYSIRSEKLKTESGIKSFTHFIINPKEKQQLELDYPAFSNLIRSGAYKVSKLIMPDSNALASMSHPPYEFVIYERSPVVDQLQVGQDR